MVFKSHWFVLSFALLSMVFGSNRVVASHAMGSDLSYQCLGNNQYKIILRFYRDCTGIAAPTSPTIQVIAPGCAGASTINVTLNINPQVNGIEVSQLCPAQLNQSGCNYTGGGNPPYPGVKVYEYTGTVTLPAACNNWTVRFTESARNFSNNLVNPTGNNLSIEATINNTINPLTNQSYCNNSVRFQSLPVPFFCANNFVTYNHGAVDPDGDSLVYTLINPLGTGYTPMTFSANYSVNQPVITSPPGSFQFNTHTGQMNFNPAQQEIDVLAIRVDEYRNGVLVGSTIRDIQVSIINCAISTPSQNPITNVQNGNQVDSLKVQACPNTPLAFDILCTDPANHNITLQSNITTTPSAIPGATLTQIGTGDSVVAHIAWTPQPSDTGCHDFILISKNDDCPINGSYIRVYTVCIFNKVQLLSASPTFCGTPVQLTATGGTNFSWQPSTGPNTVSNPNILNPVVTPTSPTMYYFTSDCGTDSVFVGSDPPFVYDAGLGGSICQNGQLPLNATTDNLYAPYKFQWVPPNGLYDPITGLPNDSVPNPVASPINSTNYKLFITGSNGCTNVDSLSVNVAGTGPVIVAKATPTNVCPNDPVQLNIYTNPQSCGISQTPCGGNMLNAQIGTGTGVTPTGSPTQYPTIFGHYNNSARHQFLYLSSELLGQFPSGGEIRAISFNLAQINTANDTMKNFEIKMGCSQVTSLSTWQPNLVTVFNSKSVPVGTTLGWKTLTLDYPYNWDGTSNLVIDICFNNPNGSALNNKMQMTPTAFNSVYYSKGSNSQCGNTGTPSASVNRPNTKFDMCVEDVSNLPISWTPSSGANAPTPTNITNPIAHPVSPVIYHVDVTATNGCVSTDYVFVNVDTSLRFYAFPKDTFLCSPTSVKLTTSTLGNPLPGNSFTYQWTNLNTNTSAGSGATLTVNPSVSTDYLVTLSGGACTLHDTVHVLIGSNIPVNIVVSPITCNGAANGKLKAVPVGGNPPLSFSWSNGVTGTDSIVSLAPNTYSVTISDAQGCSGADTVTLTQPTLLTASASAQDITCFGQNNGTVSVNVAGGTSPYSYLWNPAQANSGNLSNLSTGTYSVTVADSNACTVTASATISEPTALTVSTLSYNATSNGGSDGWCYAIAGGATPPYTYSWSNGATSDTIQNLVAGTYYVTVCDANVCCHPDSAVVTDPPPIILSFATTNNLCKGDCNGTAQVSAIGGIDPYTFTWSNGITGDSIFSLCAGVYIVTATDSAGITVTGNVNITEPTAIAVVLDTTDITCFGANNGAVQATASGGTPGYSYNWTPGGTNNPITALTPGTYNVIVTDANNCTAQASWTATEPSPLDVIISSSSDISCFGGNDGTAVALATGGTSTYTYAWSAGTANGSSVTSLPAGNFFVTVTDSHNCTDTVSFTLTEPTAITASITTTNATCNGLNDGTVNLTVGGGTSPYTYLWSESSTTEDLNTVSAGTYTVTITDAKLCTVTATGNVGEPTAITLAFNHTDPLCTGNTNGTAEVTANGGTPGYAYDWAYTISGNDNSQLANLPAGIYDVTVVDAANCSVQGSVTLTDPPSLNAALMNKEEISCANAADGSVEVSVSGGTPPIQYSWSNGITAPLVNNLAPGTYNVTVGDMNGCDTTLQITFIAPPPIGILLLTADSVSCPEYTDGSIHVSANGGTPGVTVPYEYSLDGTQYQSSEFFAALPAGIYHLFIRDSEGCTKDTSLIIGEPEKLDVSVLPTDSTISLGNSVTLISNISNYSGSAINFYTWSPTTGINCTDCPVVSATPYTHTNYTLTVNYLNDCSVSETVSVFVGNGEEFFVPNAFTPNGDGNNDILEVYGQGLATAKLKIFDRWGEKVFDSGNQWIGWDGTYKGALLNPGVYTYDAEGVYLNGKVKEKKGTITLIR